MPVALVTFHAYRSWSEANPRGYVQRGEHGVQRPNLSLARWRANAATHSPMRFEFDQQRLLIDASHEICLNCNWMLYAVSCTCTHLHLLIGWTDADGELFDAESRRIATRLKRLLGYKLSTSAGTSGNRWFSRGWDITRVCDRRHFNFLVEKYLSKHQTEEHGVFRCFLDDKRGAPH